MGKRAGSRGEEGRKQKEKCGKQGKEGGKRKVKRFGKAENGKSGKNAKLDAAKSVKKEGKKGGGRPGGSFLPKNPAFVLEGAALVGIVAYLFYDSPVAAAALSPLVVPYYRRRSAEKLKKEKRELSAQFREALSAIITALRAGYSAENAFCECRREMAFQFGDRAMITREMGRIEKGLENHVPLERLLLEFSARWEIEEISEFAEVFAIARRSGGNLPEILGRTAEVIQDRMEIDTEIELLLSSRKFEQTIMEGVPFFIIFYLGLTTQGFFDVLYHNAGGAVFMTGCLAAYLAAVAISDKIMEIEL